MRTAIKVGVVGAVVLLVVGVASGWGVASWSGGGGSGGEGSGQRVTVAVTGGCVSVEVLPAALGAPAMGFDAGARADRKMGAWEFAWLPRWERAEDGRVRNIVAPLWIPAAGLLALAGWVWGREAWVARRRGLPGHCRGCGYNRARVAPYDACPGCGWGGGIVVGGEGEGEEEAEEEVVRRLGV